MVSFVAGDILGQPENRPDIWARASVLSVKDH